MIYFYDKEWNATRTHRDYLVTLGARWNGYLNVWETRYAISPDVITQLTAFGIGIDDPMLRLSPDMLTRVDAVVHSKFWQFESTATEEYDIRADGEILLISDRSGYGFSATRKHGDHISPVSVTVHGVRDYILRNPIKRVVLYHDFFDRFPPFTETSAVTDPSPNILEDRPAPHVAPPPPAVVETTVTVDTGSSAGSVLVKVVLPPAGTVVRVDLLNQSYTEKYWESATYRNKEQLKRWGAKFDGDDKLWYLPEVPSVDMQERITNMGIDMRIRPDK